MYALRDSLDKMDAPTTTSVYPSTALSQTKVLRLPLCWLHKLLLHRTTEVDRTTFALSLLRHLNNTTGSSHKICRREQTALHANKYGRGQCKIMNTYVTSSSQRTAYEERLSKADHEPLPFADTYGLIIDNCQSHNTPSLILKINTLVLHYATNRKVAGSIPNEVIFKFT
jgi:hypothetical protein